MQAHDPYGLVGQVLDGQFRVDAAVGEGGFSVVYRGHHLGLDEPVAVKCLKLQQQLGSAIVETFVRRFRDESKIHYKLSSASLSIARTIAAGTAMSPVTQGLVPYMVLEWLDGFPLSEALRARRERGERGRPLREIVRMLDGVAEGMAIAHSMGVVHRDLNPSNLFVVKREGAGDRIKVMDFGVAKVVSDHAMSLGPRMATMGQIRMFTPAYGAPEQFDSTLGAVGPHTDVYAFALLITELLGDKPAIGGDNLGQFLDAATNESVRPTPRTLGLDVGDAVEALFRESLSTRPGDRPSDLGEFWGRLKNAMARDAETRPSFAPPSEPPPSPATERGVAPPAGAGKTGRGTLIMKGTAPSDRPPAMPGPKRAEGFGATVRIEGVPDPVARVVSQPIPEPQISFQPSPMPPPSSTPPTLPEGESPSAFDRKRSQAPVPVTRAGGGDGAPIGLIVGGLVFVAVAIAAVFVARWYLSSR